VDNHFTHLDATGRPGMVDVSGKEPTQRRAVAECFVDLPPAVLDRLENGDIVLPKGPVFQTAVLAGIMGAKQTGALIPLCHPLGLDQCDVRIGVEKGRIRIECTASVMARTGVEMEALTAVSVAALTVYDMCKALSHDIVVNQIRLIEKTGGKKDFRRSD
jgi:cyclic pyranopterin phosphate synthase